ncbi:hypothetical protein ACIGXM_12315 [Kitasatospora sp. NPDC052896]|uniref:hypothetical protein n=1 Tax=Kitasatospora sp. NPDC052896 TaxID=3364061 RepID=UPI0037C50F71
MSGQQPEGLSRPESTNRTVSLDEIATYPVVITCMGRTCTAAAVDGTVHIHDRTDITNYRPLGSVSPAATTEGWELIGPRGVVLAHARDLLHA